MKKLTVLINFLLVFIQIVEIGYTDQGKVKIIFEDGYYYTQLESGEKFEIVKQHEPWALNTIVLSPDEKYVAYTRYNCLGFECEGRDVYYCKVDGTERTFLHRFEFCIDTLLWESRENRDFIFAIPGDCMTEEDGISVIDPNIKAVIYTFKGKELKKKEGIDCFMYSFWSRSGKLEEAELCLENLLSLTVPDSFNLKLARKWGGCDILCISTDSSPLINLSSLTKIIREKDKDFPKYQHSESGCIDAHVFSPYKKDVAFTAHIGSYVLFGIIHIKPKKLLFLDYSNIAGLIYPNWSNDGKYVACIRRDEDWIEKLLVLQSQDNDKFVYFDSLSLEIETSYSTSINFLWSPNNQFLAIQKTLIGGIPKIALYHLDLQKGLEFVIAKTFYESLKIFDIKWSKDSKILTFHYYKEGKKVGEKIDLTELVKE